ncbi:hypothetical protein NXS19_002580 [Fusarium pseudograminearum]|nr:hypothetical protein NXS19_002580 [Fusarium pseudograminearum]
MCGPENTNRPRGGALVSLNPPTNSTSSRICGDLAFHTPGSPASSNATHARLTPNEECSIDKFSDLHVIIHTTGDLTRHASDCGLFRQFSLPTSPPTSNNFVESQLQGPLSLEVGARWNHWTPCFCLFATINRPEQNRGRRHRRLQFYESRNIRRIVLSIVSFIFTLV